MTASTWASVTSSDRRHRRRRAGRGVLALWLALTLGGVGSARAEQVYLAPDAFVTGVFGGAPPAPAALWLRGPLREQVRAVLGHDYASLRLRYWLQGGRSAWVLEDIGKERPITTGIAVGPEGIEQVRVLVYRESRGHEVRHPFFTEQFRGAQRQPTGGLDRRFDAIAGATLSSQALTRLAQMALLLHAHVSGAGHGG